MKDRKVLRSFVMVSQIGISMMVPIFLCGAIGYWLNKQFHGELYFPVMLLLGIGAAFRSLFTITASFYRKDVEKEKSKLAYMEDLRNYHEEHPEEDFSDVMEGKKKRYPENKGATRH